MTVISVIIMVTAAVVGLFLGAMMNDAIGGAILLALIAGLGCVIHTIEKRGRE